MAITKKLIKIVFSNGYRFLSTESYIPFHKIPSPPAYPFIGHGYLFMKNGPYDRQKFTEAVADLSTKYGPVFLLKFPGQQMVVTTDAENAFKLFQNEGKYPIRPGLSALEYYHKKTFNTVGVVSGNGEVWYKLRKAVMPLLTKSYLKQFDHCILDIAQDFTKYILLCRNEDNVVFDVCSHLYRYSAECISVISPGKRLRCFSPEYYSCGTRIINANCDFMDGLWCTFSQPPIWKIFKTTAFKKLTNGYNIVTQYVDSVLKEPIKEWENSFVKKLFENTSLSRNEARLLAVEVFLGGIDAVATTIAMTFHYLSKDPVLQDLAFEDISKGSKSYLKACLKETLRLSSSAGGTSRVIPTDLVMNGFLIPANTTVTVLHSVSGTMEKYFGEADSYKPERWLQKKINKNKNPYSSYASLPFGYGSRVCPGRWLSERECVTLLCEVLKKFTLVSATNSPVGMVFRTNRKPDRPINIQFVDRIFT